MCGILIYDGFGIINPPTRKDIKVYRIDAMDKAAEMKNSKVVNMIVLGGLLEVCPVISHDGVEKALYKTLPERHHGLIPLNMQALKEGAGIIQLQAFSGTNETFCAFPASFSLRTAEKSGDEGIFCFRIDIYFTRLLCYSNRRYVDFTLRMSGGKL